MVSITWHTRNTSEYTGKKRGFRRKGYVACTNGYECIMHNACIGARPTRLMDPARTDFPTSTTPALKISLPHTCTTINNYTVHLIHLVQIRIHTLHSQHSWHYSNMSLNVPCQKSSNVPFLGFFSVAEPGYKSAAMYPNWKSGLIMCARTAEREYPSGQRARGRLGRHWFDSWYLHGKYDCYALFFKIFSSDRRSAPIFSSDRRSGLQGSERSQSTVLRSNRLLHWEWYYFLSRFLKNFTMMSLGS